MRLPSPDELLSAAVEQLEYDRGVLLRASERPEKGPNATWVEKGDWLALAHKVGADRVFFIDQHPVAIFAKFDGGDTAAFHRRYNAIWCMARPQLLFLAREGELSVFDLGRAPITENETADSQQRLLDRVETIAAIQSKFAAFHRERLETGAIFGEQHFSDGSQRADRTLIRDLKQMRKALSEVMPLPGIKAPAKHHLHALIGRAIFVRYLEDRGIITREYFERVAARRREWTRLLAEPLNRPILESELAERWFFRVLRSKEFTYALFEALADNFNGDTFPLDDEEFERISPKHLSLLQSFLLGEAPDQQSLFFHAYRFDVIPIELISTIYEEFYNENVGDEHNQGSHYTPPALVEFVLGRTLTPEVLATRPRVCDPSCGSGIFLVESFRRIVRHQWAEQAGRKLSRDQLLKILREQIAGIDINEEAVRVAAFSLCLALLHYQSPPEINADRLLPHLMWLPESERHRRSGNKKEARFFNTLLCANAFEVNAEKFTLDAVEHFGPGTASVVVGNPPWGDPKPSNDDERAAKAAVKAWCARGQHPVGDKEMSQAFIHLTLGLLVKGGRAGLLVSSGVLFKHHQNSRDFRRTWLAAAQLRHVVNFSHVRHLFFSDNHRDTAAISPFVSVVFDKSDIKNEQDNRFAYWSAKRTAVIEGTKSVILNRGDMHWLSQHACLANEQLWKIYWWGGHRDEALVQALKVFSELGKLSLYSENLVITSGRGFELTKKGTTLSGWLKDYRELPAKRLTRYGHQNLSHLVTIPDKVYRQGCEAVYHGHRLLVGRGIKGEGHIVARFETKKYCFRNSIHGARLEGFQPWQEAAIVGVFWSSLARYFYWITSGSWGFWHDEIHLEDVERMPIAFPSDTKLRNRIVRIVEELQSLDLAPDGLELGGMAARSRLPKLEQELDEAVFDLYGLNQAERDLIREMCSLGLDLFYRRQASEAVQPVEHPVSPTGTLKDVARAKEGLDAYLRIFLEIWNDELAPEGEFGWQVLSPPTGAPLLAVCFVTRFKRDAQKASTAGRTENWQVLLERLAKDSLVPTEGGGMLVDTFYRYVSDREIVILKRNERRFWTRTAAREDAEATMLKFMSKSETPMEA